MNTAHAPSFAAFLGPRRVAEGPLPDVARVAAGLNPHGNEPLLVFDGEGRQVELDLRGGPEEAAKRAAPDPAPATPRGRGRPQLGVVAREVTLLPRHWEWLAAQPGGASVTLRKLVEEARRSGTGEAKRAQERTYRFLTAIAGNLPRYEEALRALFGGDATRFDQAIADWPPDVRQHAHHLAEGAFAQEGAP
jgi:hypothetical protein